jgi:hypothetical protein
MKGDHRNLGSMDFPNATLSSATSKCRP